MATRLISRPTPPGVSPRPEPVWCVRDDDGLTQYFWAELPVTRNEYLANSGKEDCA